MFKVLSQIGNLYLFQIISEPLWLISETTKWNLKDHNKITYEKSSFEALECS